MLARPVNRDHVRSVTSGFTKIAEAVTRSLTLFEIPRAILCAYTTAGGDSAGFLEECDEEWLDGWETCGDDADVHFHNLPDVFCLLLAMWTSGYVSEGLTYNTMSLYQ
jgi:hypothetical protein